MPPQDGYGQRYMPPEYRTPSEYDGYPRNVQEGYPQPMNLERDYQYPQQEYSQQRRPLQGGMYPPQQGYSQQGFPQRSGMNPWVAGGLGVLGGGLAGYGMGQAVGEMQQHISENPMMNGEYNPEQVSDPGFNGGDAGWSGMDFGGGDFGGE